MKKTHSLFLILFLSIFTIQSAKAQTTYTWNVQSGDWGTAANWTPNGVPGVLDSVVFTPFGGGPLTTCSITSDVSCRGAYFTPSNSDIEVVISGSDSFTITNQLTFSAVNANGYQLMNTGTGHLTCAGVVMASQVSDNRSNQLRMSTGSLIVRGDIVLNGANAIRNEISFSGAGTFSLSGNITGTPAIQIGTASVTYAGTGNQAIAGGTYENLTIGGAGTKTPNATLIINGSGKLTLTGTASLSGTVQYFSGGTLEYADTTDAYTIVTGDEWPATDGPTDLVINLSGSGTPAVTMLLSRTISGELLLTDGALAIAGNTLTLSGTISGTDGSLRGDSSASLVIGGSGAFGTLYMDQGTNNSTNVLRNLTINRSSVGTLSLGDSLKILAVVLPTAGTLTTGGFLKLLSSSVTEYGQIAPGGGTISGNITMLMGSSNTYPGWRPIALPLHMTIGELKGIGMLFSNHTPANQRNVYYWDAEQNGTTGNSIGWTAASSTDNSTRAYQIYVNSNGLHDFTGILSATGTNKTGDQIFNLSYYVDPAETGSDATGWNYIPNPYPSNIDVSNLLGSGSFSPAYKAIHVYSYKDDQYQVFSGNGVNVVNYHNTDTAGTIMNLSPFVGFWVKTETNQALTLTDNDRTTNMTGVAVILKKQFDLIRLNMVNTNGKRDQCVVYLKDDATYIFDNNGDAYKLNGMNGAPALSTLIGATRAAINALPSGESLYSVPVSFISSETGKVTFMLDVSEMDPAWTIELEDKLTGKRHNFKEGDYAFDHTPNQDQRFVIHMTKGGVSALLPLEAGSDFRLYQDHDAVKIDAGFVGEALNIEVYGTDGRLLETLLVERNGIQVLKLSTLSAQGFFIIHAVSSTQRQILKTIR